MSTVHRVGDFHGVVFERRHVEAAAHAVEGEVIDPPLHVRQRDRILQHERLRLRDHNDAGADQRDYCQKTHAITYFFRSMRMSFS